MTTFDPSVPVMSPDRQLSSFSQGTEPARIQPLAEVPKLSEKYVAPDYKANLSGGKLLEGIGTDAKDDIGLVDNIIKSNVDKTLNQGIDQIRDSFGVAQATDIESGVAAAVGRGGAEGVSLTDDTKQTPLELQKLGTRVDGLTEAYKQGDLSNSAYYAKMEAYVKQVKQQFPGYGDDIDAMVSTKVGTNPANALRSSIQQDVSELQKKVNTQNDKWTTYEHTNAQYIYTQWPNYDELKAKGQAPSREEIQTAVGTQQARDYNTETGIKRLALKGAVTADVSSQAEDIATQRAADIAGHLTVGVTNKLGIKTPQDFTQLLDDVRNGKRPPLTPDEKQAAAGVFATMEQQYGVNFDKFVNNSVDKDGLPMRPIASYTNPAKLSAIRQQGMQGILDIKNGLFDDKYGIMAQSANWSKATNEAGEGDFLRRAPIAPYIAAGRKALGDQGIMTLMENNPYLQSSTLEGFRQFNQAAATQGDKSLRGVFDTYKAEGINDGTLNQKSIADTTQIILHADKMEDKDAGAKAVQHAFGPDNRTLLDAFNTKDQVPVFTQLVSKPMTTKILKMDGKSQETYFGWANDSFVSIYEGQANQANQVAANLSGGYTGVQSQSGNIKLVYDPGAVQFNFKAGSAYQSTGLANSSISGLNAGLASMKEVWKAQGKDPTEELNRLLPVIGIEPGTPVYRAVQDALPKKAEVTSP